MNTRAPVTTDEVLSIDDQQQRLKAQTSRRNNPDGLSSMSYPQDENSTLIDNQLIQNHQLLTYRKTEFNFDELLEMRILLNDKISQHLEDNKDRFHAGTLQIFNDMCQFYSSQMAGSQQSMCQVNHNALLKHHSQQELPTFIDQLNAKNASMMELSRPKLFHNQFKLKSSQSRSSNQYNMLNKNIPIRAGNSSVFISKKKKSLHLQPRAGSTLKTQLMNDNQEMLIHNGNEAHQNQ